MSIFTEVPDGFFQTSRIDEQRKAVEQPVQYSLKTMMVIVTATAVAFGAMRAVVEGGTAQRQNVRTTNK